MKVMVDSLSLIKSNIISLNAKIHCKFNQLGDHVLYSAVIYDQGELYFNMYGI